MLRYIPLVRCESCLKPYAETDMRKIPEDDEGGVFVICPACEDALNDLGEEFWSNSNREAEKSG